MAKGFAQYPDSGTLNKIRMYIRQELQDLYDQCTEAQQDIFCRMYGSVGKISMEKIPWAIVQIENTLSKRNSSEGEG